MLNIPSLNHPGRAFAVLLGRNDPSTDPAKHGHRAQIEHPGGFGQGDFATLSRLAVHVDRNTMRIAEATETRLRPSVQPTCSLSGSVSIPAMALWGINRAQARIRSICNSRDLV
jgi:hypothetical protein